MLLVSVRAWLTRFAKWINPQSCLFWWQIGDEHFTIADMDSWM